MSLIPANSNQFLCYPNPFEQEINIKIQNPTRSNVRVGIYNLTGQKIKNLINDCNDEQIDLIWDGKNALGQAVASGIYICKMNNHVKQLIYKGN
jgi:hypothetical protein